jgi:hypothetical protein
MQNRFLADVLTNRHKRALVARPFGTPKGPPDGSASD